MAGLGTVRPLTTLWNMLDVNAIHGSRRDEDTKPGSRSEVCKFVQDGTFHRLFAPHLAKDGNGVDFSKLVTRRLDHLQNYEPEELLNENGQPYFATQNDDGAIIGRVRPRKWGQIVRQFGANMILRFSAQMRFLSDL